MTPLSTPLLGSLLSLLILASLCPLRSQSPPQRPALSIGYSTALHHPVGHYQRSYAPFFTQGLSLGLPTAVAPLWLIGDIRLGTIDTQHSSRESIEILHVNACARFTLPTLYRLKPYGSFGVNNTALHTNPQNSARDADLIATWENEFGIQTELGVVLHHRFLRISSGIVALRVLSQPYRFDTIAATLCAAVELPGVRTQAGKR
jgi:hypothetical protein